MGREAIHRLAIRAMQKDRGDQKRKISVCIPEFRIWPGELVAVTGANGTGKSTFLDMLGLILSPDKVDTFLLNTDEIINLTQLSPFDKYRIRRRHFAYLLQKGGLLEFLTVEANIRFAANLTGTPVQKIEEISKILGLEDILHKRPGKISGGQRQKAAIARALAQEADIILADEPTSAMDSPSAARLMQTFKKLTEKMGTSLVMVTHDIRLVQNCANRYYHFQIREASESHVSSILLPGKRTERV